MMIKKKKNQKNNTATMKMNQRIQFTVTTMHALQMYML